MIAMAAPVFVVGMIEDLIAGVSARVRFLASLGAGLCFCLFTGYAITDVKLEVLAVVLAVTFLSVGLTALAVASLSNAINMIDGLNGLAAGTLIILLAAVAFVGYAIADALTAFMALAILASVAGFAVWNYPFGRVFLSDGGAYFLGALLAGIVIIIAERNAAVSPFFSLFIVIYPFYELVRSTLHRMMTRGARPFAPDNKHLHSLVFKAVAVHTDMSTTAQNAVSSAIMLLFPLITAVLAVKWFDDRGLLIIGILGFVGVYEATVMTLKAVQDTVSVASC
jgi:UDP-N-acetylmuramyl pentapeptide phosphotransferase/UDP-N-acetylglucosamine-1-phosphate transferase